MVAFAGAFHAKKLTPLVTEETAASGHPPSAIHTDAIGVHSVKRI